MADPVLGTSKVKSIREQVGFVVTWVCVEIGRPPSSTSLKKENQPVYLLVGGLPINIHTHIMLCSLSSSLSYTFFLFFLVASLRS